MWPKLAEPKAKIDALRQKFETELGVLCKEEKGLLASVNPHILAEVWRGLASLQAMSEEKPNG